MIDFCDLPSMDIAYGNYDERPAAPTSPKQGFWARDHRRLYVCDLNMQWRDSGLLYSVVDQPMHVPADAQAVWVDMVTVSGAGSLIIETGGSVYVVEDN